MSASALKHHYTAEQYLALERQASFKSEYCNGSISAMAGASREHNLIAGNIFRVVSTHLLDRPCETYVGDMRVCVAPTGLYTYPGVVAVCGEPHFLDSELDTLLNPALIIEVLSPSTEADDRGSKFAHYRRLASLREFVLAAQDKVLVERYTRQGEDWLLTELNRLDNLLRLASIDCEIPLREVYMKVQFPVDETQATV